MHFHCTLHSLLCIVVETTTSKNGQVEEESLPFVSLTTIHILMKKPLGTTAKTGQSCPESGVWKVVGNPSTTAPIAKGNTMPPYAGKAVTWELKSHA